MMKDTEEKKEAMEQEENQELDFDQLEQVTGGSIGNARKKKPRPIDDDVANRFQQEIGSLTIH